MKQANAIELNDLRCGYDGRIIIDIPRLAIPAGAFVAIIGPNGSGKTTLARAASGIISPYSGAVLINGADASRLSYRARARALAVVNQVVDAGEFPLEDYVLMGRLPHRSPLRLFETAGEIRVARENTRLTGLRADWKTPMNQLSGGERQLAAIARALTQQAGILLLDEPTAHLDIAHQVKILDLARRLNRDKGITVALIIHDLNLASEYSDRIILLDNGAVRVAGKPDEVLTRAHVESVYRTRVTILPGPFPGRPLVFPVPGEEPRERAL
ncbi:MAG: ABC transporter ATP-binding protein [Odoribacteraceae bacterium]|jgi:iron complex transport system ATP-binding protein|nr:ABC transporter ATP-binding protein [Odoribacteraceae bacterium]